MLDDDLDERTAHAIADAYGLPQNVRETYLEKHRLRMTADLRAGTVLLGHMDRTAAAAGASPASTAASARRRASR